MKGSGVVVLLVLGIYDCSHVVNGIKLELPTIYGNHMMFQQGVENLLWGWSDPNSTITVSAFQQNFKAMPNSLGKWNVTLPAQQASSSPVSISISNSNGEQITLSDILYGDVFVCSGQSNMQITVSSSLNATAEINAANYPNMRIFQVALLASYGNASEPQDNLTASIPWTSVTPSSIPNFSGHCYFFGRELHLSENQNIGLVQSDWGGTAIQVWMSPESISKCPSPSHDGLTGPVKPSCLYYSMMYPLFTLSIKGAIWDQGEANAGQASIYACLLSQMIQDWRVQFNSHAASKFDPDFPFVFRQLHAYPSGGLLGPMRLYMAGALNTTRTGMSISYDLGCMNSTAGNIHFQNKQEIGFRSALNMKALTYDYQKPYTGPIATGAQVYYDSHGGLRYFCVHVSFANVDDNNPLNLLSVVPPYHGLELQAGTGPGAWDDGSTWLPVIANLVNSTTLSMNVTLDGSEIQKNPTAVR